MTSPRHPRSFLVPAIVVLMLVGNGLLDHAAPQGPPARPTTLAEAEAAIRQARNTNDEPRIAQALMDAALIYHQQRRFDDGVLATREALERFQHQGDTRNIALALENLSVFYREVGRLAAYSATATGAAEALKANGDNARAAQVLADLAAVNSKVGEYSGAQLAMNRTLATREAEPAAKLLAEQVKNYIDQVALTQGAFVWNVWFEDPNVANGSFKPLPELLPDRPYRLVVDISAVDYGVYGEKGVRAAAVQRGLERGWNVVSQGGPKRMFVTTADATAIRPLNADVRMTVFRRSAPDVLIAARDISRKSRAEMATLSDRISGKLTESCPDTVPTASEVPSFVLSRTCIDMRTGATPGATILQLLVWAGDRPVEHVSVPLCISSSASSNDCGVFENRLPIYSVVKVNPFNNLPDGSLGALFHLYGFADGHVSGIFRDSRMAAGEVATFTFTKTLAEVVEYLEKTSRTAFEMSATPARRLMSGRGLYEFILPEATSPIAREVFAAYVQRTRGVGNLDEKQQTLEAQVIFPAPLFLPLNLMVAPGEPQTYLGRDVTVITPLPVAPRTSRAGCVSRWILVVPKETAEGDAVLQGAVGRFIELRKKWDRERDDKNLMVVTLGEFADLVNGIDRRVDLGDGRPTGILILSHHTTNILSVGKQLFLEATDLRGLHLFKGPTVAILNGCTTGGLGAVAFVQRLSELGVGSIVATSTGVTGPVAGDFVKCFDTALAGAPPGGIGVGQAFRQTRKCLWDMYDARALQYALLGDVDLTLCPIRGGK